MAQPETNSKKKPENTKQTQPHQERERERDNIIFHPFTTQRRRGREKNNMSLMSSSSDI